MTVGYRMHHVSTVWYAELPTRLPSTTINEYRWDKGTSPISLREVACVNSFIQKVVLLTKDGRRDLIGQSVERWCVLWYRQSL